MISRKATTLAALLVLLTLLAAPLVLAQQDNPGEAPATDSLKPASSCLDPYGPPCSPDNTGAGFLQYSEAPPTVNCPPPTDPPQGRPCFLEFP